MIRKRALAVIAAALLPAALFPAVPSASAQEWSGQLTSYVWGSGLGGKLTPFTGAPSLSFNKSFSDVIEDLDGAFFMSGYARNDRMVLLGDLSWSASSREGQLAPGVPAEGKLTQRSLTLAAGYRALDRQDMALDLLAGARAWRIKAEASVAGGAMSASPTEDFVDPILAARARFEIAPRWSAIIYLDLGGFGVGSEHTSQVFTAVNYQMTDNLFLSGGYRRMDLDYRSGGIRADVTMQGPLLGLTWRF